MKKFFTFFFAALMSVSMSAKTVTEDISIYHENWSWGYNSQVANEGDLLVTTLTGEWGAVSTGWDPYFDLSGWDKIVVVVESMSGCDGEWFKLKAYLRDETESEPNQMEGQLGLDAEDNVQNNLVIDLHQNKACDISKARILAIQCQPNGAVFKISRVYLEKEESDEPEKTVQQDITLSQDVWGWGYNSELSFNDEGVMTCTLTGEWGAVSTGWDPSIDLSEWERIVILVDNMNGCDGEWFKLKAYLRDYTESENNQLEGQLGLDAEDNVQNNLVIDLKQEKEGFDLTKARLLAIQCQPNGAVFKISRVYLEKKDEKSAVEYTTVNEKAVKVIRDGQVLILKNGKFYNALGAEVR